MSLDTLIKELPADKQDAVRQRVEKMLKDEAGPQQDFILLDRSGSMSTQWNEAVNSINVYAKKLVDEKVDTEITVAAFDGEGTLSYDVLRNAVKVADWRDIGLREVTPRGSTPLNDAIGKLVASANAKNATRTAIIIMTDGQENSSREVSGAAAKAFLDACRAKNWQVIFLGANYDNTVQASSLGNMAAQTTSVRPDMLDASMAATASKRATYGATGQAMFYSDQEKKDWALNKGQGAA